MLPSVEAAVPAPAVLSVRERLRVRLGRLRPELLGLLALAGSLNLWALSRNGFANDYYSAAVRSMSTSWHDFLFASLDPGGVMTVDKPPLSLWVQALSVRVFGFDSLSMLVPQALMGMASVALVYDLVRRRFGRVGGFAGGLALALTPIAVAVSRHNNPDALLVLCCVGALWCLVRGLEGGRLRWLALAGVGVGLGFETKMGVALVVVPGMFAAWLWLAPAGRGRLHAFRQLLVGGVAMLVVGGAWPALVELTPAGDRPWISGTSDNRVLSLIFEYNGLGRVDGQSGGPGGGRGGANTTFGGSAGPLRLLNSALGGQAGWLLGFALVSLLAVLAVTRLRARDARSGWLLAVGGAFVTTAPLFSFASGIFHPYYVSLLAPFAAALVGAGVAVLIRDGVFARVLAPLAIAAGVACELIVRADYPGQLEWLPPLLVGVGALAILALLVASRRGARVVAVGAAFAVLLLAPAVWAFDTLGYATSGTFPAGGPQSAAAGGFGPGGRGRARFARGGAGPQPGGGPLFGRGGEGPPQGGGAPPAFAGGGFGGPARGGFGGPGGDESLTQALAYVNSHGGGALAVSSQSSAASAILASDADVAGVGGFSGRESDVSVSWLAHEVAEGKIRWVLDGEGGAAARGFGGGLPGDTRTGARTAMAAVAKACTAVSLGSSGSANALYDCAGKASALAASA